MSEQAHSVPAVCLNRLIQVAAVMSEQAHSVPAVLSEQAHSSGSCDE